MEPMRRTLCLSDTCILERDPQTYSVSWIVNFTVMVLRLYLAWFYPPCCPCPVNRADWNYFFNQSSRLLTTLAFCSGEYSASHAIANFPHLYQNMLFWSFYIYVCYYFQVVCLRPLSDVFALVRDTEHPQKFSIEYLNGQTRTYLAGERYVCWIMFDFQKILKKN